MFGYFRKPTAESLLEGMIKTAKSEADAAARQLILAKDNLYTSEAAVNYANDRLARLVCQQDELRPADAEQG